MFLKRFISSFVIAACISQLIFTSIETAFVENNPLHVAINYADFISLQRVLERPDQTAIFINQPSDDTGETPLYHAVQEYLIVDFENKALLRNTIKELLKHGANVNNPNTDGSTVLDLPGYKGYQLLTQVVTYNNPILYPRINVKTFNSKPFAVTA